MRVMLSSNFPRPGNEAIAARLRLEGVERFHWLAGSPDEQRFKRAYAEFAAHDFFDVKAVAAGTLDIGGLSAADGLYLSGGDPLTFSAALARSTVAAQLARFTEPWLLGASGGSMQFTPNISLFRLQQHSVAQVLQQRNRFAALGIVAFEVLPHSDRHPASLLNAVRSYSEGVDNDVWCLADGAALWQDATGSLSAIGDARCLRRGEFAS
jgi:Peptidase family S51